MATDIFGRYQALTHYLQYLTAGIIMSIGRLIFTFDWQNAKLLIIPNQHDWILSIRVKFIHS